MMKYLLLISIVFFCLSCSKSLEEIPQDRLSEENFYETASDAEAAVNAVYAPFRELAYYGGFYMLLTESCSDMANGRGSFGPVSEYNGLDGANTGRSDAIWALAYRSILRANTVLERVPEIAMDETRKNEILAEARFLRALAYFDLVRNWAGVPLRLSLEDPTDLPRSSAEAVYQQIIQDLEWAETNLPARASVAGRPNTLAAKTLLAYVQLTLENWTEARDLCAEVMSANQYQLVQVQESEDFESLFGAAATTSPEEIFSFKYSAAGSQGFQYLVYIHGENTLFAPYGFRTIYARPSFPLIGNWSDDDLRKEYNLYGSYIHRNNGQVVQLPENEPFQFKKFKDEASIAVDASGNDLPVLRYADVLLMYAEAASQAAGGPTPEAYDALNQVRRRAYGKNSGTPDPVVDRAALSVDSFREAVLEERAYEFLVEGKRWNDMKRLGINRTKEIVQQAKGRTMSDAHFLWPIPIVELDNNAAIGPEDQNPGY